MKNRNWFSVPLVRLSREDPTKNWPNILCVAIRNIRPIGMRMGKCIQMFSSLFKLLQESEERDPDRKGPWSSQSSKMQSPEPDEPAPVMSRSTTQK